MKIKEKLTLNFKTLFKSIINNRVLIERRKNNFFFPFIILLLSISMMIFPTYISSINSKSEDVMRNFPGVSKPIEELLTRSLDCSVKNNVLICDENAEQLNIVVGEDIKYTIIANNSSISSVIDVVYSTPKDTDNLIILFKNYISIRYIHRDHVKQTFTTYQIVGDYSKFEGYNFKEISEKLTNDPSLIDDEVSYFVHTTYLSTLDTQLIANLSSSIVYFLLFILVTSTILKWPTLFKFKKGFKFSECLKISITSSLPALIIATISYFLFKMDFTFIFATIYVIRILFIFFKYISSGKNGIFKEIYEQTNDERYNLK